MEEKAVVIVPAMDFSGVLTDAPDKGATSIHYGPGIGGLMALHFNLIQFLVGSPLVEYDSVSFNIPTGSPTGQVAMIDTSRRADLYNEFTALDADTDTLADFFEAKTMSRGTGYASQAEGTYRVTMDPLNFTITQLTPVLRNMDNTLGGGQFSYNSVVDVYDPDGEFHFCLSVLDNGEYFSAGPTTGSWATGGASATFDFSVQNPTYDGLLNWHEVCNTTRLDEPGSVNYTFSSSGLHFDTIRGEAITNNDDLSDVHAVGLHISCGLSQGWVSPMERIDGSLSVSVGDFYNTSVGHTTCAGSITSARSFAGNTFQQPRMWTMFRGPGYVRIFAEDPSNPTINNVYYLGMMGQYMDKDTYNSPVAILTDTYASTPGPTFCSPWWRKFDYDDVVYEVSSSQYRYDCPFIINENFVFGQAINLETDIHFPMGLQSAANQPDMSALTGLTKPWVRGSFDGAVKIFCSQFDLPVAETWWDTTNGWQTMLTGVAQRMVGTQIFDHHLEQLILFQQSDEGYDWNTSNNYEPSSLIPDNTNREAIAYLPGVYWINDKLNQEGVTTHTIVDGSTLNLLVDGEERTFRVSVGRSYALGNNGQKGPQATGEDHGAIAFDMGEV